MLKSTTGCRVYFGLGVALVSFGVNWLMTADGSPFYRHFLYHGTLPDLWAAINTIPYVLAIILGALSIPDPINYHVGLFVQWFLLGVLLGTLLCRR